MGKKANKTNEDKYEDLLESVSSLLDEEDTNDTVDSESSLSSGLEGLQKRARELKRRFLLHKNHADRHNLKKICEYGLKVIKKITTATGKIDLSALEDDLDNAEVDLNLCEQEFQKDISRYDNLLQLLNEHELPKAKEQDFMLKIKNAKIDIYNATDSPEELLSEYRKLVSHKEDNNKRRKELDRLRNSLKQDIKQSIGLNQYVKDDIIRMIDTDLSIDNMEQFIGDIKIFIQCCTDWYKLDLNLICSYYDIEDALLKEYFRNFDLGPKSVSDIRKYIDFQERVKKRLLYKEEHPIEFGDAYFDLSLDWEIEKKKYRTGSSSNLYRWKFSEMAASYYKIAADKGDKYAMCRMYLCDK